MAQFDRIREALSRRPFEPFSIKMTNGTTRGVAGPEWLAIPPTRRVREIAFFSLPDEGQGDEFQTHWLNLGRVPEAIAPGITSVRTPSEENGDQD